MAQNETDVPFRTTATEPVKSLDRSGTAKGRRASPRSELRRENILRCATQLFDRQGYSNTSLDDIARAVGVTREALYYYYRNRSEILAAIIRPQSIALIEGMKDVVKADVSAPEKLRLAMQNHLQQFDRHCLEMTIGLRDELLDTSDEVRRSMARIWKQYERLWVRLIADGQASGEFDALGDPRMIAFGILGMCNWLARWYDPRKQVSIEEIIATYHRIVSQGVVAHSSA